MLRNAVPVMEKPTSDTQSIESPQTVTTIALVEWRPDTKMIALLISLMLASLVVAIDATVLVTILPVHLLYSDWRHANEEGYN